MLVRGRTLGFPRGKKLAWGANGGETAKLRKLGVLPLRPLRAIGIALHATVLIGGPSGRAMGAGTPGPASVRRPNILAWANALITGSARRKLVLRNGQKQANNSHLVFL